MSIPYTHADHAKAIVIGQINGERIGIKPTHVQARIGRIVCCARILNAWDTSDGKEMWQLELLGPIKGRMSTQSHNVRLCQGVDGRCTCVPDFRAVLEVPDGNHGETSSRESEA